MIFAVNSRPLSDCKSGGAPKSINILNKFTATSAAVLVFSGRKNKIDLNDPDNASRDGTVHRVEIAYQPGPLDPAR